MANRVNFTFTQKEIFEAIANMIQGGELTYEVTNKDGSTETKTISENEALMWIEHKVGQLVKKADAPKKLTPQQEKNEKVKEKIFSKMQDGIKYTITDMITTFGCFPANVTPQYVSAMLTQLKDANKIERTVEHNKALFRKL